MIQTLVLLALSPDLFDPYGGYKGIQREAKGFFRTERIGARSFLITPEGHAYIAIGANHIGAFMRARGERRDTLKTEEKLHNALRDLHFTAGEAYAPHLNILKQRWPYIAPLTLPAKDKFRYDVFDPAFRTELRRAIIEQCAAFKDDPWAIGAAFTDQPVWTARRATYFRNLPAAAPGRRKYDEYMLSPRATDEGFLGLVADALYAELKSAVAEGAPRHLFLGERFVLGQAPEAVLRAAGKHIDVLLTQPVVSSPQRPPAWQKFHRASFDRDHALTGGRPMIAVDWPAPFNLDSVQPTQPGELRDEAASAREAAQWLEDAFSLPYLTGVFHCQFIGTHAEDRLFKPARARRSWLKDDLSPWPTRTAAARAAHEAVLRRVFGIKD
ncbi:MAG: hypothetical protein IT162_12125 [Bryobacterales bacterium]|nr:hypothetical protein [Bryobacterales bacterium]